MSKKTFSTWFCMLVAMLLSVAGSAAAQSLSIADFDIKAGETKTITIDLAQGQQPVYGVQTDLQLSEGLTLEGEPTVVEGIGVSDLKTSVVSNGSTRLILLSLGSSNAAISATATSIIQLSVKAAANFQRGTITLSNSRLTVSTSGQEVSVPSSTTQVEADVKALSIADFSIKAGETKTVTIDITHGTMPIYGVQTDLQFSAGLSLEGEPTLAEGVGVEDLHKNVLSNGNLRLVMLSLATGSAINPDAKALISLTVKAAADFSGGTITLKNNRLTINTAGKEQLIANSTTQVTKEEEEQPAEHYYKKVIAADGLTTGQYLIVYEGDNSHQAVAFNGSLAKLDAVGNGIDVNINNGQIAATAQLDAATFTVNVTDGSLKSASNYYIGVSSNSNGLKQAADAATYANAFSIGDGGNAVIAADFSGSNMTLRYNHASDQLRFRYYKNSGQQPIALYKKTAGAPVLAIDAPTITTQGGEDYSPVTVVLSSNTEGATIYYTLNGTEPTTDSQQYTGPFTLSTTTTVKAIAYLDGTVSQVAMTTITFPVEVNSALAFAQLQNGTLARLTLTDAVVTYVNGKNFYVQDASGAIYFYGTDINAVAGQKVNGSVVAQLSVFRTLPELTNVAANNLTFTDGDTPVAPTEMAVASMLSMDKVSMYVKTGVVDIANGKMAEGTDSIVVYDTFKLNVLDGVEKANSVTGIITVYNGTFQFAPISYEPYAEPSIEPGTDMTSRITNPSFETGDLTGWQVGSSSDTGVKPNSNATYTTQGCDGDYLFNTWWQGVPITQTITDLPNGLYELKALMTNDAITAGNQPCLYLLANGEHSAAFSSENAGVFAEGTMQFYVTDGTATIGAVGGNADGSFTEAGYYWYKVDNFRLTFVEPLPGMDEIEIPTGKMSNEAAAAIAAAQQGTDVVALLNAVNAAKESINAYAAAKAALDAMKRQLDATNVYTQEAYDAYNKVYTDNLAAYEAGTLSDADAKALENPERTTGYHAANIADNFLLSAWDTNADFLDPAPYYINTWSVEGNNDGTNFTVPFFEYWIADGESLGERTLTATVNGLEPGQYDVSAWVRVRMKNGAAAPATGITMQVGDGEPVDVAAGQQVGTSQFYLDTFTATGIVGEDGVLKIKFNVAADNNISWLSFKNVMYTLKKDAATLAALKALNDEIAAAQALLSSAAEASADAKAALQAAIAAAQAAAAAGESVDALKAALASLKGAEGDFNTSVGITSARVAAQAGQLYNLKGQQVQPKQSKGLYILNGKKIVK